MTGPAPWERAARGAMLLDETGRAAPTIFAEMSALAARTGADGPIGALPGLAPAPEPSARTAIGTDTVLAVLDAEE